MIEAVNSAVANATLLRNSNLEQQSNAQSASPAGNLQDLERAELQLAPYVSLFVEVDTDFDKAVLQIRDSETGDVQGQFPSETTLRARAAQAEIETQSIRDVSSQPQQNTTTAEVSSSPISFEQLNTGSNAPRVAEAQLASATFAAQATAQGTSSVTILA